MIEENKAPLDSDNVEVKPEQRTDRTPAAAARALAEAEQRRVQASSRDVSPPELHGRGGLDPVRYGDWEVKGLAADF